MRHFLLQSPRHQSDSSRGARDSQELGALRPAQVLRRHLEVAEGVLFLRLTALQPGSLQYTGVWCQRDPAEGLTWRIKGLGVALHLTRLGESPGWGRSPLRGGWIAQGSQASLYLSGAGLGGQGASHSFSQGAAEVSETGCQLSS